MIEEERRDLGAVSWPSLVKELDRLHQLLKQRFLAVCTEAASFERHGSGGLVVAETEIASFLDRPLWDLLARNRQDALDCGPAAGRSGALARLFGLSRRELDVCHLALAPEIHPGYGRVIAYLHDDVSRTRPTIGLALDVLADGWEERLGLRAQLAPEATLLRTGLLSMPESTERPRIDEPLILDDAAIEFLLGGDPMPEAEPISPVHVLVEQEVARTVRQAVESRGRLLALFGARSMGKRSIVSAAARAAGSRIALFDEASLDDGRFRAWLRRCSLSSVWPCVRDRSLPPEGFQAVAAVLLEALEAGWIETAILLLERGPLPSSVRAHPRVVECSVPAPRPSVRRGVFDRFLEDAGLVPHDPDEVRQVAATFPLAVGEIRSIVNKLATEGPRQLAPRELHTAARGLGDHTVLHLAQRVRCVHSWDDLVLPEDSIAQLRELLEMVRARSIVLDDWEFGKKVSAFGGVTALFYGASGTGKTMAASIVAAELGMELYRIDLSRVVNKYIGETEKNLEALFEQARSAHAILFFDEADALFGKRSEVKDAHDRYANIEVAFLLQRVETYDGLAILATNMRNNLDGAFLRRLSFAIEFPDPTAEQRLEIWKRVWPCAVRSSLDLDFDYLAHQFAWTGGNIRNIALRAAYLAAAENSSIRMPHVLLGAKREFQKLGQLVVRQDFGAYAHLLFSEGTS